MLMATREQVRPLKTYQGQTCGQKTKACRLGQAGAKGGGGGKGPVWVGEGSPGGGLGREGWDQP